MTLQFLATEWLIILFIVSGIAIWIAGVKLTIALDRISKFYNIGEAMGGMIFLAIVTNLPEIAITGIASWNGNVDIAVSNILGGIAIQTVVLAFIDYFGVGKAGPLSHKSSSVGLLLEGIIVILILSLVIVGKEVQPDFTILNGSLVEWIILLVWITGIYLIYKNPHINTRKQKIAEDKLRANEPKITKKQAMNAILLFSILAVITLASGLTLELCSETLAKRFSISNALFGATFLALITALPEISTGIESAKLKDYQMAVSDIFGGNAFLPVLLLMGSMLLGKPAINSVNNTDIYLTALSIILTGIFIIGLIIKSPKQLFRVGFDSLTLIIIYIVGIIGLMLI